jgi:multiple antibiotic resistance protein
MLGAAFYVFVTLLVMVNPIEAAAAFDSLVAGDPPARQAQVAWRSTIVAAGILIAFGFAGELILRAVGISFPAFRIAGGLLLFKVGSNMVFAQQTQADEAASAESRNRPDPSVFPLAIPIITGPGALTAAVTLWAKAYEAPHPTLYVAALIVIALIVFAITYATMRGSQGLTRMLGTTGVDAIGRIMGIIVAAISIQLIVEGAQQLMPTVVRVISPG